MNGGTPSGPRTSTSSSTAASTPAIAHTGRPENHALARSTASFGTYWQASMPAITSTTTGSTATDARPPTMRPNTAAALPNDDARKNTQPAHTRWKVTTRRSHTRRGAATGAGAGGAAGGAATRREPAGP